MYTCISFLPPLNQKEDVFTATQVLAVNLRFMQSFASTFFFLTSVTSKPVNNPTNRHTSARSLSNLFFVPGKRLIYHSSQMTLRNSPIKEKEKGKKNKAEASITHVQQLNTGGDR